MGESLFVAEITAAYNQIVENWLLDQKIIQKSMVATSGLNIIKMMHGIELMGICFHDHPPPHCEEHLCGQQAVIQHFAAHLKESLNTLPVQCEEWHLSAGEAGAVWGSQNTD